MKFKTRRTLFLIIIIAMCLPLPILAKALIAVPTFEALILDFNEFCYEHDKKKRA